MTRLLGATAQWRRCSCLTCGRHDKTTARRLARRRERAAWRADA